METLTFRQPRLVALALVVIAAAGLSAFLSIARQEDPTITNLFATVTTPFPGADPARVETLVTAEIERELREVAEIDTIESVSATGTSIIQIELIETIDPDIIEGVWSEVRDAVGDVEPDLPPGAQPPEFSSDTAGTYGAIVSMAGGHDAVPLSILSRHADELADALRNIPGTKLVEIFGAAEEEILVSLDPERVAALRLTADDIAAAIGAADADGQAGRLRSAGNDLIIDMRGDIAALDRLREIILRQDTGGRTIRLGDVADIAKDIRRPVEEAVISDGRTAVLVAVKPVDGLQIDRWMSFVREEIEAFRPDVPGGIEMALIFDQSRYTAERLLEVAGNMGLGIALVLVVLIVTLGLRPAMLVALVLPLVTLASVATMNFVGLAIHQMSVTGLIVALGLLVDAAIVMTDEVGRRVRSGARRIDAVGRATSRLFAPLFASTVTTALSFMPMTLLPGPAGDFVGSIAVAVIIMLLWSFAVAVAITPAIAGWVLPETDRGGFLRSGLTIPPLARRFRASLALAVGNPVRSVALALVLPAIGFAALPLLTAQFFPGVDRDQFHVEVDLRQGASLERTRQVVDRIDDVLRAADETRQVTWVLGRSAPAFYYNITGGREDAPRYAQALVTTASPQATEALIRRLERDMGALAPEAQVLVRGLVQGPPVDAPVELRFVGPDLTVLREIGAEARRIVSDVDSVTVVRATIAAGAPEVSIEIDEAQAEALGMDLAYLSRQLEAGLEGVAGGTLMDGTEEIPVRVRYGQTVRGDLAAIGDLPIVTPGTGDLAGSGGFAGVPLSAISRLQLDPGSSQITRRNGERANTVQAFILRDVLPEEALSDVLGRLDAAGFSLPRGYRMELGGDSDARSSTLQNLLASLGVIVTLSLAVIVMTFNSFRLSFVALLVSGLSAGLSMLSLAVFNYPFGINAIIGVIGSIGVSINAAIIILTGLQQDARASRGEPDAMVEVVMRSSRHIVSTTITTFGGFLPLILAGGGFWPPFAMSIAGGVLLSTIVSFYFTPPMFALLGARGSRTSAADRAPAAAGDASDIGPPRLLEAAE